jgi:hypothetical protein
MKKIIELTKSVVTFEELEVPIDAIVCLKSLMFPITFKKILIRAKIILALFLYK